MTVLIKNCTINVADSDRITYLPRIPGNFQRDARDAQQLSPILLGRGKNENDRPYLYRVRIDLPPDGQVPAIDDTVFVARHTTNPHMRGWYTIWNTPEPTTGLLPSYILWLHKEK